MIMAIAATIMPMMIKSYRSFWLLLTDSELARLAA
jgi:hypothetical protein